MAKIQSAAEANVIRIMCPQLNCQRVLAVPANARGKLVRCKGCGTNIRIPMSKVKPEAAPGAGPPGAAPPPPKG